MFGTVEECLRLGDDTTIGLRVPAAGGAFVTLRVPTHVAERNGVAAGVAAGISLLASSIHIMPLRDAAASAVGDLG